MKRYLALLISVLMLMSLVLAGCGSDSDAKTVTSVTAPVGGEKGWTILVYMCGSDLETDGGCATDDIQEMIDAGTSSDVTVVVQTGGAAQWNARTIKSGEIGRYVVSGNGLTCVDTLPDADMGDVNTFTDFLAWGVENYSAPHMGVVFWNHGGGSISGVCFDENNSYDSLSISDLRDAFGTVCANMDDRFEFVGFDACLMATLETANMLAPYARFMFASEEVEPGCGWDYTDLLSWLYEYPSASGAELGAVQCETYYDYCEGDSEGSSITFSVTDLDMIADFCTAFDAAAKELMESDYRSDIIRAARNADNFGGNNRSEGYTNMVDLADFLQRASEYAPSAQSALTALNNAVICNVAGQQHLNAGGLAVYYPLSVQGSMELSIFRDICPSAYYLGLVDEIAYNAEVNSSEEAFGSLTDANCTLDVEDAYLSDGGTLTVVLSDRDNFYFASGSIYYEYYLDDAHTQWWDIYLGEDDDVLTSSDGLTITDDFDGRWICLNDYILPLELIDRYDTQTEYECTVYRNGEQTYLHIIYDWEDGKFYVPGTFAGIDPDTGMASRDSIPLEDGDVIEIVYYYLDENGEWDTTTSDPITIQGALSLAYETLPTGDYDYCMNLYDIYGNVWSTDFVHFGVNEDGSTYFYN